MLSALREPSLGGGPRTPVLRSSHQIFYCSRCVGVPGHSDQSMRDLGNVSCPLVPCGQFLASALVLFAGDGILVPRLSGLAL
jgi:hypothetical protein